MWISNGSRIRPKNKQLELENFNKSNNGNRNSISHSIPELPDVKLEIAFLSRSGYSLNVQKKIHEIPETLFQSELLLRRFELVNRAIFR